MRIFHAYRNNKYYDSLSRSYIDNFDHFLDLLRHSGPFLVIFKQACLPDEDVTVETSRKLLLHRERRRIERLSAVEIEIQLNAVFA